MEPDQTYQVLKQQNAFQVVDAAHNPVIQCKDETNARHYAELLNKAYYHGFKKGYSQAKKAAAGKPSKGREAADL